MRREVAKSPLPWLGLVIVVYLAVPIVAFGFRLATGPVRGFQTPGLFPAFAVSVECATISLAVVTLFGVPLAYLLARPRGALSSLITVVVVIPLALPPLMGGILLIYLVGPYSFLGRHFGGHLTQSIVGIVLAQTFVAAPFLIVVARSAFRAIDPALLDVAATLGHSELSRFRRVAVPLAADGIRAGMLLAWLRAFGEYGATVILAYHPFSLPVYTYNQFSGDRTSHHRRSDRARHRRGGSGAVPEPCALASAVRLLEVARRTDGAGRAALLGAGWLRCRLLDR